MQKKLSFPLNWWVPRQLKTNVIQQLQQQGFSIENKEAVYESAQECYEALSARLGDQYYFYGDEPSTLDCIVYGFLMTQYSARLPKNTLHVFISGYKNLTDFCNRITNLYFGLNSQNLLNYQPLEKKT